MPKSKAIFVCQSCEYQTAKWLGQCPECGEWNTLVESVVQGGSERAKKSVTAKPFYLSTVKHSQLVRTTSGMAEFDRVLGGGFVLGQVILLAGEPGVGKSTLLTQLAKTAKKDVLYVCGEESPEQIKLRAHRMNYDAKNLLVLPENNVHTVVDSLFDASTGKSSIGLVIVDSVQTLTSSELSGIAGSVGQVRLSTQQLVQFAKSSNIPVILVGHVTKDGTVAGPKVLEHLVDTVLYLEGDTQHLYRILKTTKNRFGPVSEVGIFEMNDTGLIEVKNPSKVFLDSRSEQVAGSCVTVVMEGYRPLLFEIQALTSRTAFGYPRRTTSGFSVNRLQVLIAILEKRCGLDLASLDVYLNIAGGFKVTEYACDLAVCLAIASSVLDKPLKKGTVAFGECGLLGEIRRVVNEEKRIAEAKKLGFPAVVGPHNSHFVREAIKKAI